MVFFTAVIPRLLLLQTALYLELRYWLYHGIRARNTPFYVSVDNIIKWHVVRPSIPAETIHILLEGRVTVSIGLAYMPASRHIFYERPLFQSATRFLILVDQHLPLMLPRPKKSKPKSKSAPRQDCVVAVDQGCQIFLI